MCYVITCLVACNTLLPLVVVTFPLVVLGYPPVVLVFPLVVLFCPLVVLVCPFVCPLVVLVCPLVVLVCPLLVSVYPLVVVVVLSVGFFITDPGKHQCRNLFLNKDRLFIRKYVLVFLPMGHVNFRKM